MLPITQLRLATLSIDLTTRAVQQLVSVRYRYIYKGVCVCVGGATRCGCLVIETQTRRINKFSKFEFNF